MGRTRKRFNEKARQSSSQEVCRDNDEKIVVDINIQEEKYDTNNPLIISGKKKKKSSVPKEALPERKPLSKKQRKKLANILAKKKKKINRAELLEKLAKVQARPQDLDYLTSTASMQTQGFKKLSQENTNSSNKCLQINKGSRNTTPRQKKIKLDANIVGFESSSDEDETSESEDESINNGTTNKDSSQDINVVSCEKCIGNKMANAELHASGALGSCPDCPALEPSLVPAVYVPVNQQPEIQATREMSPIFCEEQSMMKEIKENSVVIHGEAGSGKTTQFPNEGGSTLCISNKRANTGPHASGALGGCPDSPALEPPLVPAVFVSLKRQPEIQAAREMLPIFCEEQSIMEAIKENSVVVIHGETGSGKTTQVPQFLYEGGYTLNNKIIGITEPRRIAAMSMAARVGSEMNLPDVVAYHVRYENNINDKTQIKFMTDGVLLKEIRHDFFLSKYSVIIIDEAHERSVFSDILIGLLSRIVPLREKKGDSLKLVIMSATMRVQDFVENPRLFKEPPFLIRLDSRQYKVQVHFNIHTPTDYLEAAYHKVCKIHSQLPTGAILVFLTGEKEVTNLCKMLRNTFPFKDNSNYELENLNVKDFDALNNSKKKKKKKKESNDTSFCSLPKINLDDYSVEPLDTDIQREVSDDEEGISSTSVCIKKNDDALPLYTLPLYSILPIQEQEKVFQPPPAGTRFCVVSTNVAETSITIPGLKYVVDSGKVKTKVYDKFAGGISQFSVTWTSKASSNQRAGRAGRTEGGHCYRLYSSSVFEHEFLDFTPPEIQRIPVDDVLLQMKALGIDRVVNFPFPSPPDNEALKVAEKRLVLLGALQDLNKGERYKDIKKWEYSAKITPLGKAMSRFPLSPRYAKMLILSYKHVCVPYIIAIVSAMTVPEVFLKSTSNDDSNEITEERKVIKRINAGTGKSLQLGDVMVLLRVVALFEESKNKVQFCVRNGIRHKAMIEIHKMCLQLYREMNCAFEDLSLPLEMNIQPPNDEQIEILRKILTTSHTDHVARILPEEEMKLKELKNAYKCLDLEDPVFIHPSSSLFSILPRYIIYQEIVHTTKYYMKGIVEINPEWLPAFAPNLCKYSDPLEEPAPSYDSEKDQIMCTMNVEFGPWQWELPPVMMEMPKSLLKYSWFAFFLLDGKVHNFFKNYRSHLLSSPTTILKSWAKLLPRTRYLLQALIENEVDSRECLLKTWDKEPKYLLREYWLWLPNEKHMEIECKWPPK